MDFQELKNVSKSLTPEGLAKLGKLLERSRLALRDERSGRSYSFRQMSEYIKRVTGVGVGKDTLQRLEEGRIKQPKPDTLMAISAAEYVLDQEGRPYSVEDLLKIAAENLSIDQSEIKQTDDDNPANQ